MRRIAWSFVIALASLGCKERARSSAPAAARSQALATPATLVLTTAEAAFRHATPSSSRTTAATRIDVRLGERRQSITAFGGAFNEQGWRALETLTPDARQRVLRALFDRETGLGLDYCRLPIGASDYALDRYTLDEAAGDLGMEKFSIERDRQRLIPYVKAAQAVRPDLKFWASAWTPPTWMKTPAGFDGGALRDDPAIYAAYALYLARFVESYAEQGIPIQMLVPQNEPQELTHYPSCGWTPDQYVTFLRDHLGPLFGQRRISTQVFVGTINRDNWDVLRVLGDSGAAPFIAGVALQWNGLAHVARVHATHPQLPIMQSETECGNNHWQPGFNPERAGNDFAYAAHTWRKFRDFFRAGASSYMLWNLVLDEQGKNIDSTRPWPQNSAVVIDRTSRRVIYTPMFWATKHFSALLGRGAQLLGSQSSYEDQLAFVNPDGSVVLELMNAGDAARSFDVALGARARTVSLPAQSFATVLLPPG